jgi:hypothetical protein
MLLGKEVQVKRSVLLAVAKRFWSQLYASRNMSGYRLAT